jgi:uncharacterized protein (TIGR02444 family)
LPGESLNPQSPSHGDCGELQYDNEFWRFSLAVYSRAGVAEECLALQEKAGADINVLLFCAWTGMQAIVLSRDDIEQALRLVVAWQDNVVRPLRGVRQSMKALDHHESESFRTRVKSMEIEAEQIEQAVLFAYSKRLQSTRRDIREAVIENIQGYLGLKAGPKSLAAPVLVDAALHLRS